MTTRAAAAASAANDDVAAMGYEQARDALIDIVRQLEAGGATLEESLELWERGETLATRCEQWLDGARARLDAAVAARDHQD
ncbi:MAG: exodeoxyribonuclease VII small subunit [Kineosporiaceae bacterium]